jgi:hypothetical protein
MNPSVSSNIDPLKLQLLANTVKLCVFKFFGVINKAFFWVWGVEFFSHWSEMIVNRLPDLQTLSSKRGVPTAVENIQEDQETTKISNEVIDPFSQSIHFEAISKSQELIDSIREKVDRLKTMQNSYTEATSSENEKIIKDRCIV